MATNQDGVNSDSTSGQDAVPGQEALAFQAAQQKYAQEAAKRFKPEGSAQFVHLKDAGSARLRTLGEDPWADHTALDAKEPIKNGATYTFIILGAGYGGLLFAARLIQAGLASGPDDIRLIDTAGGFGGTWWWNRYPGLHCDVESYTYMPLLEETGYMPKSKYAPGPELLEHANRIATHFDLQDKALFRSKVHNIHWDEDAKLWDVDITENRAPGEQKRELKIRARYFIGVGGIFVEPHVPKISGLESFSGDMFHTSRWDYKVTGGSPENYSLTGLEGKRVGIIGTGATAIQAIPQIAKWAKEVYVFQRTPSFVSWRGNRPTDLDEWKTKIAYKKGWQRERAENFNNTLTHELEDGEEKMVDDGWTQLSAYCAILGTSKWGIIEPTPEKIGEHVGRMHMLDFPHTEAARQRVEQIVQDAETASKLKSWYPTWCKRPTFSDEYLQTFNLPHVHLVDTDGKGVDSANQDGLVIEGKGYPLDILVLSTGFQSPGAGVGDPSVRFGMDVCGRGGKSIHDKWATQGASTLHGVCSNGFPNLFFNGLIQSAGSPNYVYMLENSIRHVTHIISEAERRVGESSRPVIETTVEAEEGWAMAVMQTAAFLASVMGCTPSYNTLEGDMAKIGHDPAAQMKAARASTFALGMKSLSRVLQEYRDEGSLKGLEIVEVATA